MSFNDEDKSVKSEKNRNESDKKKAGWLVPCIMIICIVLIIVSGFALGNLLLNGNQEQSKPEIVRDDEGIQIAKEEIAKLQVYAPVDLNSSPLLEEAVKEVNGNIVGWLYLGGINLPLLESNNESYYLNHTVYDQNSQIGAQFLDYHCSRNFTDWNNIVYGQNLSDGIMFGALSSYDDESFFSDDTNKYGRLWTVGGKIYDVSVFSYCVVEKPSDVVYTTALASKNDRAAFLSEVKNQSIHYDEIEINADDQILTLSTYSNKGSRYVVIARMRLQE